MTASAHPVLTVVNLVLLLAAAVAITSHLRLSRMLLILGPDAAIVPSLLRRRRLAYSEMSDYWLAGDVRGFGDDEIEGRLLTLHSCRAGVRAMEVFVADTVAIDPALIERLDEIRQANRGAPALPALRRDGR